MEGESLDHIFWTCSSTRVLWAVLLGWFGFSRDLYCMDFNSFLVAAMQAHFSPQITHLWRIGVVTLVWSIWNARNSAIFDGNSFCAYRTMVQVKHMMMEANTAYNLGYMLNTVNDLLILHAIGVKGNPAPPKQILHGTWWPPLNGWIKVNSDGSARGCPGTAQAGGVFRNYKGEVLACFHVSFGIGFAFEAELLAAITAVEIAHVKGWKFLWLESDSTFVVGMFEDKGRRPPWRLAVKWRRVLGLLAGMEFRASHIYREGNTVADRMSSSGVGNRLWDHAIPQIEEAVRKDMISPRFYRYK